MESKQTLLGTYAPNVNALCTETVELLKKLEHKSIPITNCDANVNAKRMGAHAEQTAQALIAHGDKLDWTCADRMQLDRFNQDG